MGWKMVCWFVMAWCRRLLVAIMITLEATNDAIGGRTQGLVIGNGVFAALWPDNNTVVTTIDVTVRCSVTLG